MNLTNKYALVTGGAHRVCKAISVELSRACSHVAVHYRSAGAAVTDTIAEIEALGVRAVAVQASFNGLATFYRKGFINGIENAKRPETRTRKIAEMMALLKAGKKQK